MLITFLSQLGNDVGIPSLISHHFRLACTDRVCALGDCYSVFVHAFCVALDT